jgi:hypothetical protein
MRVSCGQSANTALAARFFSGRSTYLAGRSDQQADLGLADDALGERFAAAERSPIRSSARKRSDLVLLGKQHVRNGWLKFTAQKDRNRKPVALEIPLLPVLQEIIEASPTGDLTFLVSEFERPFTPGGGNWFRPD